MSRKKIVSNNTEKRMVTRKQIQKEKRQKLFNHLFNFILFVTIPFILVFFSTLIQKEFAEDAFNWMTANIGIVTLNIAIIYIAFFALRIIYKNSGVSFFFTSILYLALPLISKLKFNVRGEVLILNDFSLISNAKEMIGFVELTKSLTNIVTLIILFIIATSILINLKEKVKVNRKTSFIGLMLSVTFVIIIFSNSNILKSFGVNENVRFSPNIIHDKQGTLLGLYSNAIMNKIEEPKNYGKEEVYKILDKANQEYALNNEEAFDSFGDEIEKATSEYPNIIMIMSESFCDPTVFPNISYSKDPIEYVKKLSKKYLNGNITYGNLITTTFAGGTSNIEYEAFTGNLSAFMPYGTVPYTDLLSKINNVQTIQKVLKNNNYKTIAIHSYEGRFYNRDKVYPDLGFDTFLDANKLKDVGYYGKYVGDVTVYKNIIDQIEKHENDKEPLFIWALTMQNHTPYTAKNFDKESLYIKVSGDNLSDVAMDKLTGYVNGIYESSKRLEILIDYLEQTEKPTILMFYGDHNPSLYEVYVDTHMIKTQDTNKWTEDEMLKMHSVPYFIYQNFNNTNKMEKTNCLGTMQLGNVLLNLAGVKKTSYFKFLDTVEYISIRDRLFVDENVKPYTEIQPQYQATIDEQKMLQYDMIYGKNYVEEYEIEKLKMHK